MKSASKSRLIRPTPEEDLAISEAIASDPDTWEATDEDWANMEWGDPFTIRALLARSFRERKTAFMAWFSHLAWSWTRSHGTKKSPHSLG